MKTVKLNRPRPGAEVEELESWWEDFVEALDTAGVEPGGKFFVMSDRPKDKGLYDLKRPDEDRVGPSRIGPGEDTSISAAKKHWPKSGSQRYRVLREIIECGEEGATSDEVSVELDIPLQSVKPRMVELREGGWIRLTGKQRRSLAGSKVDVHITTEKAQRRWELP